MLKAKAELEKKIIELNGLQILKKIANQLLKDNHQTEVKSKEEIIRIKDDEISEL